MTIQDLQTKIELRAAKQAKEEIEALISKFRTDIPKRMGRVEVHANVKTEEMKFSRRVLVEVDNWEFWETFKDNAIEARTEELINEFSEKVLNAVDELESLKTEVSYMKEG